MFLVGLGVMVLPQYEQVSLAALAFRIVGCGLFLFANNKGDDTK